MHAPNDLKFEPEIHLSFCLYYEATWGYQRSTASAAAYLERFKEEIRATGRVLEWLYLAEPDKESRLGWRPTSFSMSLLVEPRKFILKSARECALARDKEAFDSMISTVLGNVDSDPLMRARVILVLSFLDLIRWARNGDVVLIPNH